MAGMLENKCFKYAAKTCVYRYNRQLNGRKKQGPLQPVSAQAHMPADAVTGHHNHARKSTTPGEEHMSVLHQEGSSVAEGQGPQSKGSKSAALSVCCPWHRILGLL